MDAKSVGSRFCGGEPGRVGIILDGTDLDAAACRACPGRDTEGGDGVESGEDGGDEDDSETHDGLTGLVDS